MKMMLAKEYNPERVKWGDVIYSEPKLDGVRVCALVNRTGAVAFFSRNGRELKMFDHLADPIQSIRRRVLAARTAWRGTGFVLDGEMVAPTFGDIAGAIHTKGVTVHTARFAVFHMMGMQEFRDAIDSQTQAKAREFMIHTMDPFDDGAPLVGRVQGGRVYNAREVVAMNQLYQHAGMEGSMIKNMSVPWMGKRSWDWMKIKDERTADVRVIGMKEGKGKYAGTCGALVVDYNGRHIPVSGMSDTERAEFWRAPRSIIGKTVEVAYQQETVHGSLRHPRFKRIRHDK